MIAAITNIDPVELFRWMWRYFIMGAIFVFPAYFALRFGRFCFSGGREKPIKPSLSDPKPVPVAALPSDNGSAVLRGDGKKDNLSAGLNGGASSMAARFGHVLGWAGNIVGGLLMLMGSYFGAVGATDKVMQFLFLFV